MAFRFRTLARALHTTRVVRGGGESAPWGSIVNEPGGRLFGEAILKPGQRRKVQDWEVPFIGTHVLAAIMLVIGLNSRPDTSPNTWARAEAKRRMAALEDADENDGDE